MHPSNDGPTSGCGDFGIDRGGRGSCNHSRCRLDSRHGAVMATSSPGSSASVSCRPERDHDGRGLRGVGRVRAPGLGLVHARCQYVVRTRPTSLSPIAPERRPVRDSRGGQEHVLSATSCCTAAYSSRRTLSASSDTRSNGNHLRPRMGQATASHCRRRKVGKCVRRVGTNQARLHVHPHRDMTRVRS